MTQKMMERKYIMSVMKKVYKFLFDTLISKTPESCQPIRNFIVKKYIKRCGGGYLLEEDAVFIKVHR